MLIRCWYRNRNGEVWLVRGSWQRRDASNQSTLIEAVKATLPLRASNLSPNPTFKQRFEGVRAGHGSHCSGLWKHQFTCDLSIDYRALSIHQQYSAGINIDLNMRLWIFRPICGSENECDGWGGLMWMEADEMRLYFPMNIEKREVTRWFVSIIGSQLIYIYIYICIYIFLIWFHLEFLLGSSFDLCHGMMVECEIGFSWIKRSDCCRYIHIFLDFFLFETPNCLWKFIWKKEREREKERKREREKERKREKLCIPDFSVGKYPTRSLSWSVGKQSRSQV